MSRYHVSLFCFLVVAHTALAWVVADGQTLQTALEKPGVTLVAFIAPSELKSQALEQEWVTAFTGAQTGTLLSIDCEAEPAICTSYGTSSFPSLELFDDGVPKAKYLGSHRASAIVNFVSRMSRPAVTDLDLESVEAFKKIDDVVFIGYINAEDAAARQSLSAVADKYRQEFTFGLVSVEPASLTENMETSTVVCHVAEDERTKSFDSFAESNSLDTFVSESSRRTIGELTRENQQRLLNRGWPMVYLFAESEADRAELRQTLLGFGKSCSESLTCVTVDHLEFPDLQVKLGLEPGVFPAGAVHQLSQNKIYPYPRGLALEKRSLQKWGLDVWQGRVKPWTPPGGANAPEGGQANAVTRKISMANIPGVNIRVAGRDEL